MGNIFSSSGSSGGLLGDITGDFSSATSFIAHPMEYLLIFIAGIVLLAIVYKLIAD